MAEKVTWRPRGGEVPPPGFYWIHRQYKEPVPGRVTDAETYLVVGDDNPYPLTNALMVGPVIESPLK